MERDLDDLLVADPHVHHHRLAGEVGVRRVAGPQGAGVGVAAERLECFPEGLLRYGRRIGLGCPRRCGADGESVRESGDRGGRGEHAVHAAILSRGAPRPRRSPAAPQAAAATGAPDAGLRRRMIADTRVTTSPTGNTSRKVTATLKNGFL